MFNGCEMLQNVTLSSSITSIGANAFGNCYTLYTITIPASVTEIGSNAFVNCYNLVEVYNLSSVEADTTNGLSTYAMAIHTSLAEDSILVIDDNGYVFTYVEKDISKEEYYQFASRHGMLNLRRTYFETYHDIDDEYTRDTVMMICNGLEESSIILNYSNINREIYKYTDDIACTFNKKIIEALNDLYYFDFLKQRLELYGHPGSQLWFIDGNQSFDINESPIGYSYDYLAIFIRKYGHLLDNI